MVQNPYEIRGEPGNGALFLLRSRPIIRDIRERLLWNSKLGRQKGGVVAMGRRGRAMSDAFKVELAKDLGFYDTVQREGWGGIKAKDAGNMVKRAIEIAEQALRDER